ncbi:MAG: T9SS type A sorting domain-containing protein [Bacteroidetes bacterium]|nr:T9SS type A sorting domain-containing protein [Bacteroidota bacterium]
MIRFLLSSLSFLIISICPAQNVTYVKTYGNFQNEVGSKIIEDFDGNYVIAGKRNDTLLLLKTDSSGTQLLLKTFSIDSVEVYDIIQTYDSAYLILGRKNYKCFLLKSDKNGNIVWLKNETFLNNSYSSKVVETTNHHLWITGNNPANSLINCCYGYLCEYTDSGNLINFYSSPAAFGRVYYITMLEDGNFIVPFSQIQNGPPHLGVFKMNTTTSQQLWYKYKPFVAEGGIAVLSNDKNIVMHGSEVSPGRNLLLKMDTAGNTIWNNGFGFLNNSTANLFAQNCDSGFIMCGHDQAYPENLVSDVYMVFINSLGDSISSKFFNFTSDTESRSMIKTKSNNYLITGFSKNSNTGDNDILLIKTDCMGNILHSTEVRKTSLKIYPNPANSSILISADENPIKYLKIIDYKGSEQNIYLKSNEQNQTQITISTAHLPSGIYFLKLFLKDTVLMQKLVVMH